MNKGARQLNQPFVKGIIRTFTLRQPDFFQHVMGFIKQLLIEAFEITQVVGIQISPVEFLDGSGNLFALTAHRRKSRVQSPKSKAQSPKPKVQSRRSELTTVRPFDTLAAWQSQLWAGASARCWAAVPSPNRRFRPQFQLLFLST